MRSLNNRVRLQPQDSNYFVLFVLKKLGCVYSVIQEATWFGLTNVRLLAMGVVPQPGDLLVVGGRVVLPGEEKIKSGRDNVLINPNIWYSG